MVKVFRFVVYFFFFLSMLILFLPKENLFYFAQQKLVPYKIEINAQQLEPKPFSLVLHNTTLSFEKIEVAHIKQIDFLMLFFYNGVSFEEITLSSLGSAMMPSNITKAEVIYTLFNPLQVTLRASGDFGVCQGSYNLQEHQLQLYITPSKLMLQKYKSTLRMLKKLPNGEYLYVQAL